MFNVQRFNVKSGCVENQKHGGLEVKVFGVSCNGESVALRRTVLSFH